MCLLPDFLPCRTLTNRPCTHLFPLARQTRPRAPYRATRVDIRCNLQRPGERPSQSVRTKGSAALLGVLGHPAGLCGLRGGNPLVNGRVRLATLNPRDTGAIRITPFSASIDGADLARGAGHGRMPADTHPACGGQSLTTRRVDSWTVSIVTRVRESRTPGRVCRISPSSCRYEVISAMRIFSR